MATTLKDLLTVKLAVYGKAMKDIKYLLLQSHAYNHEWKWTNDFTLIADITGQINVSDNINPSIVIVGDDWWIEFLNKMSTSMSFRTFPHLQPAHGLPQTVTKADILYGF